MPVTIIRDAFVNNLLPVLLCAATGFVLGRTLHPDIKTTSRLAFYIFSPCLVFVSLERVEITGGELGQLVAFTFAMSCIIGALAYLVGLSLKANRHLIASLVVASMFVNSGNYGLAATKFAFGEDALARALVCFVFGTVVVYTLGVLIASMAGAACSRTRVVSPIWIRSPTASRHLVTATPFTRVPAACPRSTRVMASGPATSMTACIRSPSAISRWAPGPRPILTTSVWVVTWCDGSSWR